MEEYTNKIAKTIKQNMPDEEDIYELADLFKIFSDSTRVNILICLSNHELCVSDIAYILEKNQSSISHQLRVLKQSRLVKNRRVGKNIYYSLDDDHVKSIITAGFEHINE